MRDSLTHRLINTQLFNIALERHNHTSLVSPTATNNSPLLRSLTFASSPSSPDCTLVCKLFDVRVHMKLYAQQKHGVQERTIYEFRQASFFCFLDNSETKSRKTPIAWRAEPCRERCEIHETRALHEPSRFIYEKTKTQLD